MKAWYVCERDAEAGEIHWATTRGKAKLEAKRLDEWVSDDTYWPDIVCRRAPEFDGEPRELSREDWLAAGYSYIED